MPEAIDILLPAVTEKSLLTVDAPRAIVLASRRMTLFPDTIETVSLKSLLLSFRVTLLLLPAVTDVVPVTARAPVCVIAPPVSKVKLPLTVERPRIRALASRRLTLLPLPIDTTPVKLLLALSAVIL